MSKQVCKCTVALTLHGYKSHHTCISLHCLAKNTTGRKHRQGCTDLLSTEKYTDTCISSYQM